MRKSRKSNIMLKTQIICKHCNAKINSINCFVSAKGSSTIVENCKLIIFYFLFDQLLDLFTTNLH